MIEVETLSKISEIKESSYTKHEFFGDTSCKDSNQISLHVPRLPACHLFQPRNPALETTESVTGLEDGIPEVDFWHSKCSDSPLHVVIEKHFVPVVQWLWCQELAR